MTPTDEIREAMTRYRSYRSGGNPAEIWDRPENDRYRDLSIIADAVLNPPPDVAEAMRRIREYYKIGNWRITRPQMNIIWNTDDNADIGVLKKVDEQLIASWLVSITAPNTEPPK